MIDRAYELAYAGTVEPVGGYVDRDENGQEFHEHMMTMREREEQEALRHVIKGTATVEDAKILAFATGHNFNELIKEAA